MRKGLLLTLMIWNYAYAGCSFEQTAFSGNFGIIHAGQVGELATSIAVICPQGQSYSISPTTDKVNVLGKNEVLEIKVSTEPSFAYFLKASDNINGVGTGKVQYHNLFFRITSTSPIAPDYGKGKVLVNSANIAVPYNFIIR